MGQPRKQDTMSMTAPPATAATFRGTAMAVVRWFDSSRGYVAAARENLPDCIDWARILPFVLMHLVCLGVFWTGVSPIAALVALIA
jgi:stearoyl-CoA desaturase (Delta-9 desaturase)